MNLMHFAHLNVIQANKYVPVRLNDSKLTVYFRYLTMKTPYNFVALLLHAQNQTINVLINLSLTYIC